MQNHEIKDSLNNLRKAFNDLKDKFEIMVDILDEQDKCTDSFHQCNCGSVSTTNTVDTGTTNVYENS